MSSGATRFEMADQDTHPAVAILESSNLSGMKKQALLLIYLFSPTRALIKTLLWIQPETYRHCLRVEALSMSVARENIGAFSRGR
jgi:hypothetical protein